MTALDLNDATQAPSPDGGWSASITSVPNAVIATTASQEMIQPMGVFDAAGRYIHQAVLWRGRVLMTEPDLPEVQETLPGRWIWGGILLNHFGHFLTETTGRLWALDAVKGPVDGIIFVSKREGDEGDTPVALQNFHRMFFDMVGLDLPIKIVTKPTKVELLEVPGQGFGIGPMAAGTAEFRAFMAKRFAKDIAPTGSDRLYISRSGLSAIRGGILEETALEMLLADSGYEIYHPQKHPLPDQIARYKGAKQIVALDGSALHLLAMAGHSGQQVAMIKRRDSHASDSIVTNLAAFMQTTPVVVDVILQDWIRSDRKRADRFSVGELNFTALGEKLAQAGFIPANSAWETLTEAEAQTAIQAIEKQLKGKLTFAPVPRKGGKVQRPAAAPKPAKAAQAESSKDMPERRAARLAKRSQDAAPTERRLRRMEQNAKK
jgi:Glycosyltransferase 61